MTPLAYNIFGDFRRLVIAALDDLAARGALPSGLDFARVAVEPPRDPAHGDLATNAAMVLAGAAKQNPMALAEMIAASLCRTRAGERRLPGQRLHGRGNAARFSERAARPCGVAGAAARDPARRNGLWRHRSRRRRARSMSSSSRPIRPGRCMSGTAAAPWSATRSPRCWRRPGSPCTASITSTTPARRSMCWRARPICATARRSAKTVGPIPEGFYPGEYLVATGRALAERDGDKWLGRPEAEWLGPVRDFAVAEMMRLIRSDLASLGVRSTRSPRSASWSRAARSMRRWKRCPSAG